MFSFSQIDTCVMMGNKDSVLLVRHTSLHVKLGHSSKGDSGLLTPHPVCIGKVTIVREVCVPKHSSEVTGARNCPW